MVLGYLYLTKFTGAFYNWRNNQGTNLITFTIYTIHLSINSKHGCILWHKILKSPNIRIPYLSQNLQKKPSLACLGGLGLMVLGTVTRNTQLQYLFFHKFLICPKIFIKKMLSRPGFCSPQMAFYTSMPPLHHIRIIL